MPAFGFAAVKVTCADGPDVWTSIHATGEEDAYSGLYLSSGGNGVGAFETFKNVLDGRGTKDEIVDHGGMLRIDVPTVTSGTTTFRSTARA